MNSQVLREKPCPREIFSEMEEKIDAYLTGLGVYPSECATQSRFQTKSVLAKLCLVNAKPFSKTTSGIFEEGKINSDSDPDTNESTPTNSQISFGNIRDAQVFNKRRLKDKKSIFSPVKTCSSP